MPQMAPMLWLVLFSYFTLVFILFIIISYYTSITNNSSGVMKSTLASNEMIWAW